MPVPYNNSRGLTVAPYFPSGLVPLAPTGHNRFEAGGTKGIAMEWDAWDQANNPNEFGAGHVGSAVELNGPSFNFPCGPIGIGARNGVAVRRDNLAGFLRGGFAINFLGTTLGNIAQIRSAPNPYCVRVLFPASAVPLYYTQWQVVFSSTNPLIHTEWLNVATYWEYDPPGPTNVAMNGFYFLTINATTTSKLFQTGEFVTAFIV